MAKIKFYYRSKKEIAPLTLRFVHKGNNLIIDEFVNSTYIISKTYWNDNKKIIKTTNNEARNHKAIIQNLENHIIKEFGKANSLGVTFPKEWFKNEIENFFGRTNKTKNLNFLDYYIHYIELHKTIPLSYTGKPLAPSTIKTYRSAYNLIKNFNDEVYKLNYDKITTDFYEDYLLYLYEKNYSNNYIGAQIKTIKTIMNASFEDDLHSNLDYKKRAFKKPTEEVFNIYLTPEELNKIYYADTSQFKQTKKNKEQGITQQTLEHAKDIFLIGANTGLRVSDLNQLNEKNIVTIENKLCLKIKTQKTNTSVTIPISPIVQSVFIKNNNKPPTRLNAQSMNYALKELGELAEINELLTKETSKGGKKIIKEIPKYKLISNHTARRSFCTNAYKSGMKTIDIMAISTHTSEKSFFNYIKVTEDERAIEIGKHKFFNEPLLKSV